LSVKSRVFVRRFMWPLPLSSSKETGEQARVQLIVTLLLAQRLC
jgi:hypothetical protein